MRFPSKYYMMDRVVEGVVILFGLIVLWVATWEALDFILSVLKI